MTYKIVSLPGDGIGPEIIESAIKIIDRISKIFKIQTEITAKPFGGFAYDKTGEMLPEETLSACFNCEAILFGAVGGPKWDGLPHTKKPEAALLKLRKSLNLFANLRPAKTFDALLDASSIKEEVLRGSDFVVVRELTGDVYFGEPRGLDDNKGWNNMIYEKYEVERIARIAFELAKTRNKKVISVDKANVLECSQFWRKIVHSVYKNYQEVQLSDMYVDNAAMQVIRDPRQFDVILTGNIFGDILSDLAGQLTGSLGMLPSASLGDKYALYEPIHGSAPDIAGQNKANPIGTILSAAMMFDLTYKRKDICDAIYNAVEKTLNAGFRTADIYSQGTKLVGTKEITEIIAENIK